MVPSHEHVISYFYFNKSIFYQSSGFTLAVYRRTSYHIFVYHIICYTNIIEMFLWSLMWKPFAINDDLIVSSKSWIKPSILPIPDKHFSFAIARTQIRLIWTETWPTSISSNHVTLEFLFLFWTELSISTIKYANLNLYLASCSRL